MIEPSFGITRILCAVFEHCFRRRNDENRGFFAFPGYLAPVKCSVLPLSNDPELHAIVARIKSDLLQRDLPVEIDDSSVSIGRRYARTDEIGIPFAVTVDFQSVTDGTVTIREIQSMSQVRVSIAALPGAIVSLTKGETTWGELFPTK